MDSPDQPAAAPIRGTPSGVSLIAVQLQLLAEYADLLASPRQPPPPARAPSGNRRIRPLQSGERLAERAGEIQRQIREARARARARQRRERFSFPIPRDHRRTTIGGLFMVMLILHVFLIAGVIVANHIGPCLGAILPSSTQVWSFLAGVATVKLLALIHSARERRARRRRAPELWLD